MRARVSLSVGGLLVVSVATIAPLRWRDTPPPPSWRVQFATAAAKIRFTVDKMPERDSGLRADVRVPAPVRNMRIAYPQAPDTADQGRLEFRITSATGYPRLGIAPGVNYVWKDRLGGAVRLLVIPANPSKSVHWLTLHPHTHLPPMNAPRLLIASASSTYGMQLGIHADSIFALSCTRCDMSWCISNDTSASESAKAAALPSMDAIAAYFRRHRIDVAARERGPSP